MIEIRNISVAFGEQRVLDGFSLSLPDTGTVALMGPSGCGKTTLLRAMANLVPYTGTISGLEKRRVGVLFQEDRLLPWSSALANVASAFSDDVPKKQKQSRAAELLMRCKLSSDAHNKYPDELSGGMKKRVAIARLLAFACDVWLLDEPFRGLDANGREQLMDLLLSLWENRLIVTVTHDAYEAGVLGRSVIQLSGPPLIVNR